MSYLEIALLFLWAAQAEARSSKVFRWFTSSLSAGDGRSSEGHPPCVLEARDFGGFQSTYAGESVDRTAKPWQASVAAKFDERRGKYVIDYATLGETIEMRITIPGFVQTTLAGRDEPGSVGAQDEANEEARSTESVLQWFPSPGGLPIAGILDEIIDDESCERTIIQWGRKVLEHWARETKETGENEIFDMEAMKKLMSARPETFAPLVIGWKIQENIEQLLISNEAGYQWTMRKDLRKKYAYVKGSAHWNHEAGHAVIDSIQFSHPDSNEPIKIPLERSSLDFVRSEVAAATKGKVERFKAKDMSLMNLGTFWRSLRKLPQAYSIAKAWELQ